MTYNEAKAFILKGRNKQSRPLSGRSTTIQFGSIDATIEIVYHNTAVVSLHPDNTFTIETGGWNTVTTKKRIRDFSPVSLTQSKGELFILGNNFPVKPKGLGWHKHLLANAIPFNSSIRVDAQGSVLSDWIYGKDEYQLAV